MDRESIIEHEIKKDKIELHSLIALIMLTPLFYFLVSLTWEKINSLLVFILIPLGIAVIRKVFIYPKNIQSHTSTLDAILTGYISASLIAFAAYFLINVVGKQ
jgi:ACR3 family arsenite efflux pump ArsB